MKILYMRDKNIYDINYFEKIDIYQPIFSILIISEDMKYFDILIKISMKFISEGCKMISICGASSGILEEILDQKIEDIGQFNVSTISNIDENVCDMTEFLIKFSDPGKDNYDLLIIGPQYIIENVRDFYQF